MIQTKLIRNFEAKHQFAGKLDGGEIHFERDTQDFESYLI